MSDYVSSAVGAATLLLILTPFAGRYKLACAGIATVILLGVGLWAMIDALHQQSKRKESRGFDVVVRSERDSERSN